MNPLLFGVLVIAGYIAVFIAVYMISFAIGYGLEIGRSAAKRKGSK